MAFKKGVAVFTSAVVLLALFSVPASATGGLLWSETFKVKADRIHMENVTISPITAEGVRMDAEHVTMENVRIYRKVSWWGDSGSDYYLYQTFNHAEGESMSVWLTLWEAVEQLPSIGTIAGLKAMFGGTVDSVTIEDADIDANKLAQGSLNVTDLNVRR